MKTSELAQYLDGELKATSFRDYCPNGLQVEGRSEVGSILCAATATLEVCCQAAADGYDAILCHHGIFWKGEPAVLTGPRQARIKTLLSADVNLLAYHLPLDVHPQWGNNVALAEHLGWPVEGFCEAGSVPDLICHGRLPEAIPASALVAHISERLDRPALALGAESDPERPIQQLAWCTGAAQGFIEQAAALGADAYISGEVSLATTDQARELGILYVSAGHHATERYGVQKLGKHLAEKFGLRVDYQELANPV